MDRKDYDKGWAAGANATPAKVEAADRRQAPAAWYLGFFDREAGAEKYESL